MINAKNKWKSISLILLGIAAGSLVISIWALSSKETSLFGKEMPSIFEYKGTTYVQFPHPIVYMSIIEVQDCPEQINVCNTGNIIKEIQQNVTYGIKVRKISEQDPEAEKLIKSLSLKYLPAFLFDKNLSKVHTFKPLQTRGTVPYFNDLGQYYMLNYASRTKPAKFLSMQGDSMPVSSDKNLEDTNNLPKENETQEQPTAEQKKNNNAR